MTPDLLLLTTKLINFDPQIFTLYLLCSKTLLFKKGRGGGVPSGAESLSYRLQAAAALPTNPGQSLDPARSRCPRKTDAHKDDEDRNIFNVRI